MTTSSRSTGSRGEPWWRHFAHALWQAALGIDKLLNFLALGRPWETISHRLKRARGQGRWLGRVGCRALDLFDPEHCTKARQ